MLANAQRTTVVRVKIVTMTPRSAPEARSSAASALISGSRQVEIELAADIEHTLRAVRRVFRRSPVTTVSIFA